MGGTLVSLRFFFFNDTATTEIYTLSLHDALPISVIVVPDVQGLAHPLGVAVDEAEVAVVGTAPNPWRLEHDAHGQPFRAFHVVLDLLPRWHARPEHELIVCGQELPVEKVLQSLCIH